MKVVLIGGYEVDLRREDGLDHLFGAIAGESIARVAGTPAFEDRGLEAVFDACSDELHYVAGQMLHARSSITLRLLLDEFGAYWARKANELGS